MAVSGQRQDAGPTHGQVKAGAHLALAARNNDKGSPNPTLLWLHLRAVTVDGALSIGRLTHGC